eukprot:3259791-Rhodomonas_salina.2
MDCRCVACTCPRSHCTVLSTSVGCMCPRSKAFSQGLPHRSRVRLADISPLLPPLLALRFTGRRALKWRLSACARCLSLAQSTSRSIKPTWQTLRGSDKCLVTLNESARGPGFCLLSGCVDVCCCQSTMCRSASAQLRKH